MTSPCSVEETEAQSVGGLPRTLDWSPELGAEPQVLAAGPMLLLLLRCLFPIPPLALGHESFWLSPWPQAGWGFLFLLGL